MASAKVEAAPAIEQDKINEEAEFPVQDAVKEDKVDTPTEEAEAEVVVHEEEEEDNDEVVEDEQVKTPQQEEDEEKEIASPSPIIQEDAAFDQDEADAEEGEDF